METQKFNIEVDGVLKEAELLKVLEVEDKEYAVYSIEKDEELADIFASRVEKDEEQNDKLVDIEDNNERQKVLELVNVMFS